MNKKKKISFICFIILLFIILIMKLYPFGTEYSKNTIGKLTIPKFSILEEECCMFCANFKSIRSKYILQKELDKTMKNYKKCNRGYYDEKNDISITEYGVERGIIFNHFYIVYDKENYCNSLKNESEADNSMIIKINNKTYNVILEDNKTVKKFINKLPQEFNMNELNGNEKYIYLDYSLYTNSYNPKHIEKGDIMLYGDNCLVIFYKSFDTSYSYTKIGHIDDLEDLGNGSIKVKFEK